jgi:hypothetical protein
MAANDNRQIVFFYNEHYYVFDPPPTIAINLVTNRGDIRTMAKLVYQQNKDSFPKIDKVDIVFKKHTEEGTDSPELAFNDDNLELVRNNPAFRNYYILVKLRIVAPSIVPASIGGKSRRQRKRRKITIRKRYRK